MDKEKLLGHYLEPNGSNYQCKICYKAVKYRNKAKEEHWKENDNICDTVRKMRERNISIQASSKKSTPLCKRKVNRNQINQISNQPKITDYFRATGNPQNTEDQPQLIQTNFATPKIINITAPQVIIIFQHPNKETENGNDTA